MLSFEAVTTFAPRHWESHARRCVETFGRHWSGMRLIRYVDDELEARSSWLAAFKRRHAWRPTDNYRLDAVRFAHKVAALELALADSAADVLVWLDADCVTHAPVDAAWLAGLLGAADFGYLKRAGKYPECGFMMFRIGAATREFIAAVVRLYATDELFCLAEWHDSWAIEHIRAARETAWLLRCTSLSGTAESTGHPLVNGPLGARIDHLKGKRKRIGRSLPGDLVLGPRHEPHWTA